jgi:hypothetical protein
MGRRRGRHRPPRAARTSESALAASPSGQSPRRRRSRSATSRGKRRLGSATRGSSRSISSVKKVSSAGSRSRSKPPTRHSPLNPTPSRDGHGMRRQHTMYAYVSAILTATLNQSNWTKHTRLLTPRSTWRNRVPVAHRSRRCRPRANPWPQADRGRRALRSSTMHLLGSRRLSSRRRRR